MARQVSALELGERVRFWGAWNWSTLRGGFTQRMRVFLGLMGLQSPDARRSEAISRPRGLPWRQLCAVSPAPAASWACVMRVERGEIMWRWLLWVRESVYG